MVGLPVPSTVDGVSLLPYIDQRDVDLGLHAYAETGLWITPLPGRPQEHLAYPDILNILDVPDLHTGELVISPRYVDQVITAKDREVRTDRWKLLYSPLRNGALWSLFDLEHDPMCHHDISRRQSGVFHRLKEDLIHWMEKDPERRFVDGHLARENRE